MTDRRKGDIEVEHTAHGMVIHLPDFSSLRMKETAEFNATVRRPAPGHVKCTHWRTGIDLDEEQRTVHCRKCDAKLDPFDALMELVKGWDRVRDDFTRAREELRETRLRVEVLTRLEKNVRERLKRLGIKVDDGWWMSNISEFLKKLIVEARRERAKEASGQ
jgi:hypothetical protein